MDKYWQYYCKGAVSAYIELLRTGIREVCLPNIGFHARKDTEFIKTESAKYGFKTLLVVLNRRTKQGKKFKVYQIIIYVPQAKKKAERIRALLQKESKTKKDHRELGRLFGYSREKIEEYLIKPNV